MSQDPYIREKFTRLRITARKLAAEYFERFPKARYLTEIEAMRMFSSVSWCRKFRHRCSAASCHPRPNPCL